MSASLHGSLGWFEIATADPDAAEAFYGRLFGWSFSPDTASGLDYRIITGAGLGGGLMGTDGDLPPHALPVLRVDDVAAVCDEAARLGGAVDVAPTSTPDGLSYAYLREPGGARFSVFSPPAGMPEAEAEAPQPGAVGWFEIGTPDAAAALDFFGRLLGWTSERFPGPEYHVVTTGAGHALQGGVTPGFGVDLPYSCFCVVVEDVDATCVAVEEAGGKVALGPLHPPAGPANAYVLDPGGNLFGVFSPPA